MLYPRPIRDIHQIELTTRCNLRCHYCPHFPELPRAKEDMTWETFEQSLDLIEFYVHQGTQTELSLTGIGEAVLHPRFLEMVERSRATIGHHRRLTITTNGLLFDDALCAALVPFQPAVYISLHRPERAGLAVEAAKRHGILAGVNNSFATSAFNWAGTQKNWFVSAPKIKCEYLHQGWGVILVDGRVTTCCLDADGSGVVGTVWNRPDELSVKPWGDVSKGCQACHMEVP